MLYRLTASISLITILGCQSKTNTPIMETTNTSLVSNTKAINNAPVTTIEEEIAKWKIELFLNGEVGPPCAEDYEKWAEQNPQYYWGMQDINILKHDFNSDNTEDALVYFKAENCVGGNGTGSDFAMLVYSYNNQILTNKNITDKITVELREELAINGIINLSDIVINYKSLSNTINGSYRAWLSDDAHCCPSYKGTFNYNPINFSLTFK